MRVVLAVSFLVALLFPAAGICSQQYTSGPILFNVRSTGEQFQDYQGPVAVARDFSAQEMQAVLGGANYWAERVGGSALPAITVNLAKIAYDPNGTAYSYTPFTGRDNPDLYLYLVDGIYNPPNPLYGYHTSVVFIADYTPDPTRQLLDDNSITSTITHEMMHALGMGGVLVPTNENAATWQATDWRINLSSSQAWASRLYDIMGHRAVQDMLAFAASTPGNRSGGDFVLPQFNADPTVFAPGQVSFFPTFHGPATDALTNGKGMPLMAGNGAGYIIDGGNVLGHPALLGSIMSYSPHRNMLFTELELAALKDMGYAIDPGRFFGKSYYPTNLGGRLTQDPDLPAGQGAYLAETPVTVTNATGFSSSASYTTGLHVYRDRLTVTQAADINVSGHGAGGVRVDGVGNTVIIPGQTTVAASGPYGTGLLVSYGKNNVIDLRGTVEATGQMGIGAHFGIGMGRSFYQYSSPDLLQNSDDRYFHTKMNSDLNGPLVSAFNISGTLSGALAAIRIDRDAFVQAINVRSGALINGDIVSDWNPAAFLLAGPQYLTDLNFGGSSAAGDTDPGFSMRYSGDITAPNGLRMFLRAGTLSYNGTATVTEAAVDSGATLKGNATINVTSSTPFSNAGAIAPGNSIGVITIGGNFLNTGNLLMEFNATGGYDQLNVSGVFTHNGTVTVTPLPGYYTGATAIPFASMFSSGGGAVPSVIDSFLPAASPTLLTAMSGGGSSYFMTTVRVPGAYSRYAASANAARAGTALDTMGDIAQGDTQTLFAALDFSGPGGSAVSQALDQLSPQAYNSAVQASLDAERALSAAVLRGMMGRSAAAPGSAPGTADNAQPGSRTVFLEAYGGTQSQQSGGSVTGYSSTGAGVLGGFEHRFEPAGVTAGLHVAMGQRQAFIRTGLEAQSDTNHLDFGAHALMKPDRWGGVFLYGLGRVGVENNTMRRDIGFAGYNRTSRADWTGFSGAASAGAGYEHRMGPLSLGPVAGLDYAWLTRPQVTEYDGGGTRLRLDAASYHSLRSALGAQVRVQGAVSERALFKAGLSAQWMHELLDPAKTVRAAFVGYEGRTFSSKLDSATDSMLLQGTMALEIDTNFKLSLSAGTELFRPGYQSLHGGVAASWSF